jgi:hypothetical protein
MPSTVTPDLVARFAAAFHGRASAHGRFIVHDGKKTVKTLESPPPDDAYEKHLTGVGISMPTIAPAGASLGIIPIREDDTCFFGVVDVDDDGVDHFELEAKIVAHSLPLVVCRSRSGGAHLFCFLREAVSAALMMDVLKKFRSVLGLEKNPNGTPTEIFPKQAKVPVGGTGNWINLPYLDHENTNRYAVTGQRALSLEEFLELTLARSVSEIDLLNWADPALGPFKDGPPCLQSWHKQGCPEGGRNNALLNVGIFFRASQPGVWQDQLRNYNDAMESPLDHNELEQIVRNLEHHDGYVYTCKQHPIEPLCAKKPCKKQTFGIMFFGKKKRIEALPELSELVMIDTDPPRYEIKVNNTVIPCSLDQVLSPIQFCRLVFQHLRMVLDPPRPHEWNELLRPLTETITIRSAPKEASDSGLCLVYLRDFLQSRHKSDSVEDVLLGRAAIDPTTKRVYFRGTDFMAFLQRRQFRRYGMHDLYTTLVSEAAMTTEERILKGARASLWSVPEPDDDQTESFDHPAVRAASNY